MSVFALIYVFAGFPLSSESFGALIGLWAEGNMKDIIFNLVVIDCKET